MLEGLTARKARVAVLYVTAIVLLGSAVTIAFGDSQRLAEGLEPLHEPLIEKGIRRSFVAVWDEPHQVMVWLPTRSGLRRVDAFVQAASDHVGHYQDRLSFDLTWRVHENGVLIGSGSGKGGAQGVMDGDASRGFTFGTFPVRAGNTYDLAVDVGPDFAFLLAATPSVAVQVASATASVGLAFGEALRKPLAWIVGMAGLVILFITVWYQRSRRASPGG